jgi:hypothetical protein
MTQTVDGIWISSSHNDVNGNQIVVLAGEIPSVAVSRFCSKYWVDSRQCDVIHASISSKHSLLKWNEARFYYYLSIY